jgi:hypothetical protein
MRLETVTINGGPKGTRIINRADFDPAVHVLAGEAPEHVHVPADYEVDGVEPPSAPKAAPKPRGRRTAK